MRQRHEFYLNKELSQRLADLAAKPGASKTAIMTDALKAWLDRRGASEIEERLKVRLDKLSQQLGRIERDQQVIAETLALFIRFQFTVYALVPEPDRAAQLIGQDRFKAFIAQVGRRIAGGKSLSDEVLEPAP